MTSISPASRTIPFLLSGVLLATLACKSSSTQPTSTTTASSTAPKTTPTTSTTTGPKTASITNEVAAEAEVVAVSQPDRKVTLRRTDGEMFEVIASDAVRNFDQVAVGKVLHVRYRESLKATLLPPGTEVKVTDAAIAAARAPVGAKPAAASGMTVGVRVRVTSIDRENQIVTYQLPSGDFAARKIQTDQGREFVKSLKINDVVQLDFQQSIAMQLD